MKIEYEMISTSPSNVNQVPSQFPPKMEKVKATDLMWKLFQIFVCEAVGAGILCMPCFLLPNPTTSPDIVVPLAFGISVFVGLWITGATSGGHINPMVTLAALITRRIPLIYVPFYVAGQLAGAFATMGIAWWASPYRPNMENTYGMTLPGPGVTISAAIVIEILTTMNLILVLLASLDELRDRSWRLETGNNFPLALMVVLTVNMAVTVSPKYH